MTRDVLQWTALRRRALLITGLAMGLVGMATLMPLPQQPPQESHASFYCLLGCHDQSLRDLISNILLFLPLGWSLKHWTSTRRAVLICLASTMVIEGLQYHVISGRDSSLRDILSNTAGGYLGAVLFTQWRTLLGPDLRLAIMLQRASAAVLLGVLYGSGDGIRPAPSTHVWFGQWTPELGNYENYRGRLLSVNLSGWSPPDGPIAEPNPARADLARGELEFRLAVISGPQPPGAAPIFSIHDDHRDEQFFIGQDRRSLLLHVRNHFEEWELRKLMVRLPAFPGRTPGDSVFITAGVSNRELRILAESGTNRAEVAVPLTVGLGWTTLLPVQYPVWDEWKLLNSIWLAALFFPVGYWSGTAPKPSVTVVLILALVVGLGIVPHYSGVAATTGLEWLGGGLGAVIGWLAALGARQWQAFRPLENDDAASVP